jgi:hypothetical protein
MKKIAILTSKSIPISQIETNSGQIPNVPKNPRLIKDQKYQKLKKSIEDNPEMLGARELLVYQQGKAYVIIGGNMRYKAAEELGYKELPCKILPAETSAEQLRAILIKDNVSFGENDWEMLANEWDSQELENWGVDVLKDNWEELDYIEEDITAPNPTGKNVIQVILSEELTDQRNDIVEHLKTFIIENYDGCQIK